MSKAKTSPKLGVCMRREGAGEVWNEHKVVPFVKPCLYMSSLSCFLLLRQYIRVMIQLGSTQTRHILSCFLQADLKGACAAAEGCHCRPPGCCW